MHSIAGVHSAGKAEADLAPQALERIGTGACRCCRRLKFLQVADARTLRVVLRGVRPEKAIHVSKRVAYREREATPGRRRQNCSSDSASTDSLPRVIARASATACGSRHSA